MGGGPDVSDRGTGAARRFPRGVLAGGYRADIRGLRGPRRRVPRRAAVRSAEPHLRHHDQRDARRGAPFRFHGRHPRAREDCRGIARNAERAVRAGPGRPRHLGHDRRHAACREHGHRRRHRRDDGPAVAADDAEAGLLAGSRHGHDLRLGHARADHPAVHHSRHAGRRDDHGLPAGAIADGGLCAQDGLGRRPVRGRAHSRAVARALVHRLHPGRGIFFARG